MCLLVFYLHVLQRPGEGVLELVTGVCAWVLGIEPGSSAITTELSLQPQDFFSLHAFKPLLILFKCFELVGAILVQLLNSVVRIYTLTPAYRLIVCLYFS